MQKFTDKLRNMKTPDDLMHTCILNDTPHPLKLHTGLTPEEEALLTPGKALFFPKKITKNYNKKDTWDDNNSSNPGYVDEAGNFIINNSKKIPIMWFVNRNGSVEGPFTELEMKNMCEKDSLKDTLVKRDFDKGFVCVNKLLLFYPKFYNSRNLNKYFVENQIIEQKEENKEFFSSVVGNEKNTRLSNFMRSNNINASAAFIIKTITGMRKIDAIRAIKNITGLAVTENTMLIELIIEESKTQILSDVDKDGFSIESKRKGYQKY